MSSATTWSEALTFDPIILQIELATAFFLYGRECTDTRARALANTRRIIEEVGHLDLHSGA